MMHNHDHASKPSEGGQGGRNMLRGVETRGAPSCATVDYTGDSVI